MRKTYMLLGLLITISMVLSACGPAAVPNRRGQDPDFTFGLGDVPTLDPAVEETSSSGGQILSSASRTQWVTNLLEPHGHR
jgi:hypothetical protein